jgi:hypothetical protein
MEIDMLKIHNRNGHIIVGERSLPIEFEGMRHAPENELGVVFLFSKLARRFGFITIDVIQPHFPDCWAYRRTTAGVKRTWIEFEFRSHSFKAHLDQLRGMNPKRGVVVCWENDWSGCEEYAEVIELRTELGFGREVWIQNTLPEFQAEIDNTPRRTDKSWTWTVSKRARPGDLVLMYRAGSKAGARKYGSDEHLLQSIANIFKVKSFPNKNTRWGCEAVVTQVALLKNPLRLAQMRSDRVLRHAPFVRRSMLGRNNVTPYWYRLHGMILRLNTEQQVRGALLPFAPERL